MSVFSASDIQHLLPHRFPFQGLDRVDSLEPGVRGVATKNISIADPVFHGHFPDDPIYPGVLVLEAAAQLAGIVSRTDITTGSDLGATDQFAPPAIGYLASVKRFKWTRVVRPGDCLTLVARAGTSVGALREFSIDVTVDGVSVASGSAAIARATAAE